jgi:hypothetical protein
MLSFTYFLIFQIITFFTITLSAFYVFLIQATCLPPFNLLDFTTVYYLVDITKDIPQFVILEIAHFIPLTFIHFLEHFAFRYS